MSMLDLSVEMLLANEPGVVANWCNQYGGDTCKGGGGKAAAKKEPAAKQKTPAKEKKAKAPAAPKTPAKSTLGDIHERVGKLAREIVQADGKTTKQHHERSKALEAEVTSAMAGMKKAELAKQSQDVLGMRTRAGTSAAKIRDMVGKAVRDRIGAAFRAGI